MPSEISWRGSYVVFSGLAAVLFAGTIFLPETPRWLIKNGFMEEGLATLVDLQGDGSDNNEKVVLTYQEIVAAIEFEANIGKSPTWWEIFTQYTRRTVMGITSQMFAQLNGINVSVYSILGVTYTYETGLTIQQAILYFLPENLLRAGFDVPKSLLYTGACSTMLVAGIIPTLFLVDHWGRRPILIIGGMGMALCLSAVGGLQYRVDSLSDLSPELAATASGIFACTFCALHLCKSSGG
jgi:MFS family permease